MPPYFKQHYESACSLAAFRSVLAQRGIRVSEVELMTKIEPEYGKQFKNVWNPTIARLAREYGIATTMYADWPLFKPELLSRALQEYADDPEGMDIRKYENPADTDDIPEPLSLAYTEMFRAIELGCDVVYTGLDVTILEKLLQRGSLVQTSIKTELLYPGERDTFHSILIYALGNDTVSYHDPARQPAMTCSVDALIGAANGTGACIVYDV